MRAEVLSVKNGEESKQWLVIRCGSSKTLQLARKLASRGAWTPAWKRNRRLPRSNVRRLLEQPAMPSFVFVPECEADDLPQIPGIPFGVMEIEGVRVRIADHELEPLRRIDITPKAKPIELPKPGARMKFASGPFQGLACKVVYCRNQRQCTVMVEGFPKPMTVPPALLIATAK